MTSPVGAMWAEPAGVTLLWRGPTIAYRRASQGPYALACHPDIRPSSDGRTSDITLHAGGSEILVVSRGATEGTLLLRGANPPSVDLLRELALRVNGAPTLSSESRRGLSLHTFARRDGVNRLEIEVNHTGPEPNAWPVVVEATHLQLLLGHDWVVLEHLEALDLPDAIDADAPRLRLVALQRLKAELVPAD